MNFKIEYNEIKSQEKYGRVPLNICGWFPMIIQLHVGDFGFGHNICGFEAFLLTMVLLYALL